jgi:hypothetical protein
MSSFIVGKKEFVKAAGLMCGYEEAKRDSHKYFVENVRKEFEHAYALNVISVNEQYGDNEMPDEESYDDVFEAYRKKGALIQREGYASDNGVIFHKVEDVMDKRTFARSMWTFFNSVLYQIENDAAERAVAALFYSCLRKLYEGETSYVDGWWGEVELEA